MVRESSRSSSAGCQAAEAGRSQEESQQAAGLGHAVDPSPSLAAETLASITVDKSVSKALASTRL